jgi:hypothetical protein
MQFQSENGGRKARGQPRRSPHAQFRDGVRVAALKAFRAARFYISEQPVTLKQAALCHGTTIPYIEAALIVIQVDDEHHLETRILRGDESLLRVAKKLATRVKAIEALEAANLADLQAIYAATGFTNSLLKAFVDASPEARAAAARAFGHPDQLFDEMIAPLISAAAE